MTRRPSGVLEIVLRALALGRDADEFAALVSLMASQPDAVTVTVVDNKDFGTTPAAAGCVTVIVSLFGRPLVGVQDVPVDAWYAWVATKDRGAQITPMDRHAFN